MARVIPEFTKYLETPSGRVGVHKVNIVSSSDEADVERIAVSGSSSTLSFLDQRPNAAVVTVLTQNFYSVLMTGGVAGTHTIIVTGHRQSVSFSS